MSWRAAALCAFGLGIAPPAWAVQDAPSPFQYFVGDWACSGEFPSNHKQISSTIRFSLDDKTGALLKHHDDNPPNMFHAIELWAADKVGLFHDTIADPFGGVRYFTSPGWSNDAFVWASAGEAKTLERFTYMRLDAATMRINWSVSKDGVAFTVGDTLTCKRA